MVDNFKKKILFISPGIDTGGAEKQLALLAKGLIGQGFTCLIVSLTKPQDDKKLADFRGLETITFDCQKRLWLPLTMWRLRKAIVDFKPDVIQGWMYVGNIVASVLRYGIDARVYHSLRASNMDHKRYKFKVWVNCILSKYVDGVVVNSCPQKPFLSKSFFFLRRSTY